MAQFRYTAKDPKGKPIEGELEAEDRQAVVGRLQGMGLFPVKIEDVTPRRRLSLANLRGSVSSRDLVGFNRQLADLVAAGVPLVKALAIILGQAQPGPLKDIVADLSKRVQGGDTMAQSMQHHPRVFSPLAVAMVRAGETGGMLDDVLQRLADFSEAEADLRGKVFGALAYPLVMVCAGIVVIIVLLTVVIPKITTVYLDMGQALPLITQILIGITDLLYELRFVLPALLVAAVFGIRAFVKSKEGRALFDRLSLAVPVLGTVVHKRELARFARTLGNLLQNGVPILKSLEITEEVVTNSRVREEVSKLHPAISKGGNMAQVMADSPLFPPIMISMVSVGEETGHLHDVLLKVSNSYEAEVDRALKTLTSMLEPLIILALGVLVGFVVIAMLLPIMSLDPTGGA